jgi:hypothetical protein
MLSLLDLLTSRNFKKVIETPRNTQKTQKRRTSKGEEISRYVFEELYGVKFVSVRPDWLRNPKTNRNMELDGYNESLKVAFEYQGKQHYEKVSCFQTNRDFVFQQERDNLKRILCEDKGVFLVSIPCYVKHEDIKAFIISKINK